jgi:methyl-accepting chemotaxis protein
MAKDAGDSIGQVSDGSERVMESIRDISSALSEQVALSNAMTEDISRVARMAEDNHSATIESAQTAQELERLARALQDDVARFRI